MDRHNLLTFSKRISLLIQFKLSDDTANWLEGNLINRRTALQDRNHRPENFHPLWP